MHKALNYANRTPSPRLPSRDAAIDDERMLVARAAKHNSQAFAMLFDRYVNKIYKYIYYKVGTDTLAEDLTSQVFLNAWAAIATYSYTHRPFAAWLYRIAHNLVVDYFRTHHPTVSLEDYPDPEERGENVEEIAEKHLDGETLRMALRRLTRDQQEVITLKFLVGYRTADLAQILGKDPSAVRALQYRGLLSLQRMLRNEAMKV